MLLFHKFLRHNNFNFVTSLESLPVVLTEALILRTFHYPGSLPNKKQGNHRKSYVVIYENIKVMESTIEVCGSMQVIERPYCSMIPCKSYTVP